MALQGAQVVLAPAQWPLIRKEHWRTLLRARAIENQFFMVGINASGSNPKGVQWGGHSAAIDPWGEALVEAGTQEQVLVVELDLSVQKGIRDSINVFRDRRLELYELGAASP